MNRLVNSSPYVDVVASHLRSQIVTLHNILETIERTADYQDEYIQTSLKTVEKELNRLRKFVHMA